MADYGIPRQSDLLIDNWFGKQADTGAGVMKPYEEPWYRALPNWLTDKVYGPDANAQQAAGVRHLVGPENPLNLPAQFSEGVDTARTGYQLGNNLMTALGALQAGTSLPIPGIFAGPAARTANHAALAQAQKMATSGAPREAIHAKTGWFKGVDGKWRYEIDDSAARWQTLKALEQGNGTVGEFMSHGGLFDAYPDMKSMGATSEGRGASYFPATDTIKVGGGVKNRHDSALHELQHAVQGREGFASGASGADAAYGQIAGEVEARAVEARRNMTPEQRAARPPWLDYDVPEADQIVRMGGTGPQMSLPEQPKGIPGTKYLDQGSRGAGEGSLNYVVFDPATIEILRKYGLLGLMSGSVAAGAMPQQQPGILGQ